MPDRLPETDNEILALYHIDREGAWRMIYQRCHRSSIRYMQSLFNGRLDFEDVFQEACLALVNKLDDTNFTLTCTIQTFINTICRNTLYKQYRRQPSQISISPEFELEMDMSSEINEEEYEIRQNIFSEVIDLMRTRNERCYEIFQMVFYKNIGMQQIADRLGYSTAASVRQQKYKCLTKAKKEIERRLNLNSSRS